MGTTLSFHYFISNLFNVAKTDQQVNMNRRFGGVQRLYGKAALEKISTSPRISDWRWRGWLMGC